MIGDLEALDPVGKEVICNLVQHRDDEGMMLWLSLVLSILLVGS
jgi:hypothetical protein